MRHGMERVEARCPLASLSLKATVLSLARRVERLGDVTRLRVWSLWAPYKGWQEK